MAFCLQSELAKQVRRKQLGSKQANHPRNINLYRLHCLPVGQNPQTPAGILAAIIFRRSNFRPSTMKVPSPTACSVRFSLRAVSI